MADRETRARLTVNASGFQQGVKNAGKTVASEGRAMGKSLASGLNAGAKAGLDAVKSMFSSIKSAAMGLSAVVGGIGLAGLVRGAIDARSKFRELSFAIEKAGGGGQIREIGKDLDEMSRKTGTSVGELTDSFGKLLGKTGDLDFTRKTIQAIADTSTVTGDSMDDLIELVDGMNDAFGVTAQQAPDALAKMAELGKKSGVSMQEFAAKFGQIGASASKAGLNIDQTTGLLIRSEGAMGGMRKAMSALTGLLDQLGTKQDRAKVFQQLGINADAGKTNATDAITKIVQATKGNKDLLAKAFGDQQTKLLQGLSADYVRVFNETKGTIEQKTSEATDAFTGSLEDASKATTTAKEIQERANKARDEDPAIKLKQAVATLEAAFRQPQMISAIESLAQSLPPLAEGMAKLLDFVVGNPMLSAGVVMGGKALGGGLGGAASVLMKALTDGGDTAGKSIAGEMTNAGANAAGQIGGSIATAAAAFAVGLAAVQAQKLHKEQGQARTDIQQQREMAMEDAERSGQGTAYRKVNRLAEDLANNSFNPLTSFGPDYVEELKRDSAGNVVATGKKTGIMGANEQQADVAWSGYSPEQQAELKRLQAQWGTKEDKQALADLRDVQKAEFNDLDRAKKGGGADKSLTRADVAGAFKDSFPKQLNVRVTNPGEIRGGGGGVSGGPAPGYTDR